MSIIEAIVLGLVQGLTEFIPISSTAHLRVIPALAGWDDPGAAATAVIQFGTLLAVILYFWRDLVRIAIAWVRGLFAMKPFADADSAMGWYLIVGTIPIGILGLAFKHFIETKARSLWIVAASLIIIAILLAVAEMYAKSHSAHREIDQLTAGDAISIGFGQCLALIPGSSRSGSTIMTGLFRRLSHPAAARFSFLLSIPAVAASGLLELISERKHLAELGWTSVAVATVVAFVFGWLSIWFLLRYLTTHTTFVFVWYRLVLGVVIIGLLLAGVLQPFS
jgi:undecaprenyl-diphosphatase UppP